MMRPSASISSFIKGFEACRLTAYKPTVDDVWTIGYGHTAGVRMGDHCTVAQADAWFASDLADFAKGVAMLVQGVPTTQAEFDAMVSLAFNIGLHAFATSTVLADHRAGKHQTAAEAFLLWNKQNGAILDGLTRRREAERKIYLGEEA